MVIHHVTEERWVGGSHARAHTLGTSGLVAVRQVVWAFVWRFYAQRAPGTVRGTDTFKEF
jgi:hypothetical protein